MRVTVCMATYNGEKYIEEQVTSILLQLTSNDELIISDDGSSDKTLDIVKDMRDPRIRIVHNRGERGYTKNFENALRHSTGDIIFLADQDDVWKSNKVQITLKQLEKYDMVISDAQIVNSNLELVDESHFNIYKVRKGFLNNFLKTRYIGACMAFRSEILSKALPFPDSQRYCAHDYWLTIVGEAFYKVGLIETPLILYRRHGDNASSGGESSSNSLWMKLAVRMYAIKHILPLLVRK